ncbi:hypothetical protein MMC31_008240, partial [Peltigera leucophlebia]|nr:hypothetical protein [Peltigera leucophlebia]
MSSNAPASSPPISSRTGSSKLSPRVSQLSSPQLPYRRIEHLSEPPDFQPIHPSKCLIRPSLPLAPLDDFSDVFPTSEDIEEEEDQFNGEEEELIAEAAANKAFLEEDLAFNSDSNSESANDSNPDEPESDDSTSSQGSEGSIQLPRKQARGSNGLIATSSTSYAREKLIRILNEDVL